MTESSPVSHVQPEEGAVLGGCGHPVPNTIAKIIDIETGEALGPHTDGELCVAGPQVMQGYYKNENATDKTIIEGWLHTGDIAKYDDDGQFYIVDRLKELIKVKGLQVMLKFLSFSILGKNSSNDKIHCKNCNILFLEKIRQMIKFKEFLSFIRGKKS